MKDKRQKRIYNQNRNSWNENKHASIKKIQEPEGVILDQIGDQIRERKIKENG